MQDKDLIDIWQGSRCRKKLKAGGDTTKGESLVQINILVSEVRCGNKQFLIEYKS